VAATVKEDAEDEATTTVGEQPAEVGEAGVIDKTLEKFEDLIIFRIDCKSSNQSEFDFPPAWYGHGRRSSVFSFVNVSKLCPQPFVD